MWWNRAEQENWHVHALATSDGPQELISTPSNPYAMHEHNQIPGHYCACNVQHQCIAVASRSGWLCTVIHGGSEQVHEQRFEELPPSNDSAFSCAVRRRRGQLLLRGRFLMCDRLVVVVDPGGCGNQLGQ